MKMYFVCLQAFVIAGPSQLVFYRSKTPPGGSLPILMKPFFSYMNNIKFVKRY